MKTKYISLFFALVFVLGFGVIDIGSAKAQTASFPDGCGSALGYSATTGRPCNGTTNDAIRGPLAGCTTALGYSAVNGTPCSGGSVAIFYLAGCSSIYGFSAESSEPCNGTSVAGFSTSAPGLPRTGDGGNVATNALLLLTSGIAVLMGSVYLSRKSRTA